MIYIHYTYLFQKSAFENRFFKYPNGVLVYINYSVSFPYPLKDLSHKTNYLLEMYCPRTVFR